MPATYCNLQQLGTDGTVNFRYIASCRADKSGIVFEEKAVKKVIPILAGATALLVSASAAQAHVSIGVGIGIPAPVYAAPVYAPPPVVYAPPPPSIVYAPPPVVYAPPPPAVVVGGYGGYYRPWYPHHYWHGGYYQRW